MSSEHRGMGNLGGQQKHSIVRILLTAAIAVLVAGGVLTGLGSGQAVGRVLGVDRVAERTGPPAGVVVTAPVLVIDDYAFAPADLTVRVGTRVVVDNRDGAIQTVTALDGSFDTGDVPARQVGAFTAPDKPGRYPFRCVILPFMTGTLTVVP